MSENKRSFIIYVLIAFFAGAIAASGAIYLVCSGIGGGTAVISNEKYAYYKELDERYSKVNTIYDCIIEDYYVEPDTEALEDGLCKGLVEGLDDPYSAYMTEQEYQSWKESVTGEFEGIGITFTTDIDGNYVIVSVIPETPAEKAGLKAGDFIIAADGKTYETIDELSAAIKGREGTRVTVTYERNGKQHDVKITRAQIEEISVLSETLDGNIGYIAIGSFSENTAEDFEEALKSFEKSEAEGLVIDLRNNGGGLVSTCTEIADLLLEKGVIVSMENRSGQKTVLESDADATELPYVVLVNENSASASEILAGAIKDNTDYPLVGMTTFGKGIVQSSGEMEDGSALELTIMQYFSPDGNEIHKKGVEPDYVVENAEDEDKQLEKAIQLLNKIKSK